METNNNYWLVNLTCEEIAILSHVVSTVNHNYRKTGSLYFDHLSFELSLCLDGLRVNSLLLSYNELVKLTDMLIPTPTSKFQWVNGIAAGRNLCSKLLTARNNVFTTIFLGGPSGYNQSHGYVVRYDIMSSDGCLDDTIVVDFSDGTRAVAPYLGLSFFE